MTSQEAKRVLSLYRPGSEADPETALAIEMASRDPELEHWFAQHREAQSALRDRFRQIPVPADLKDHILAAHRTSRIIRPRVWSQRPVLLAAAAAIVLLLSLGVFWLQPGRPDRFTNYRGRMVELALRGYRMDIESPDLQQVRHYFATNNAPADYEVTKKLEATPLTGGRLVQWRGNPVSMTCFDRGNKRMLFLFVMDRKAVKDPPSDVPQVIRENLLQTASWTRGDKTYLLAGEENPEPIRTYLATP